VRLTTPKLPSKTPLMCSKDPVTLIKSLHTFPIGLWKNRLVQIYRNVAYSNHLNSNALNLFIVKPSLFMFVPKIYLELKPNAYSVSKINIPYTFVCSDSTQVEISLKKQA